VLVLANLGLLSFLIAEFNRNSGASSILHIDEKLLLLVVYNFVLTSFVFELGDSFEL
jgi:hypothetical protein